MHGNAWQCMAVARGMWVVIEDIDLAPFEVLAALAPLLEERQLYLPGQGLTLEAAPGFQLLGTESVSRSRKDESLVTPNPCYSTLFVRGTSGSGAGKRRVHSPPPPPARAAVFLPPAMPVQHRVQTPIVLRDNPLGYTPPCGQQAMGRGRGILSRH
eukprot:1192896-Prorocentrum_minimum.AAC.3